MKGIRKNNKKIQLASYQHCCTKIKFVEELSDENVNL